MVHEQELGTLFLVQLASIMEGRVASVILKILWKLVVSLLLVHPLEIIHKVHIYFERTFKSLVFKQKSDLFSPVLLKRFVIILNIIMIVIAWPDSKLIIIWQIICVYMKLELLFCISIFRKIPLVYILHEDFQFLNVASDSCSMNRGPVCRAMYVTFCIHPHLLDHGFNKFVAKQVFRQAASPVKQVRLKCFAQN